MLNTSTFVTAILQQEVSRLASAVSKQTGDESKGMLLHGSTDIQELTNATYNSLKIIQISFPLRIQFHDGRHCWQYYAGCVAFTTSALLT
jgi:hypothetical protein